MCLRPFGLYCSACLGILFVSILCMFCSHSAKGTHPYRKACRSRGIKVAATPLDSPCDGPVTNPGNIKTLRVPSKGCFIFYFIYLYIYLFILFIYLFILFIYLFYLFYLFIYLFIYFIYLFILFIYLFILFIYFIYLFFRHFS